MSKEEQNPPRRWVTAKGTPCDHIPGMNGTAKLDHTERYENGRRYFQMHFGAYGAPRTEWVHDASVRKRNDSELNRAQQAA